MGRYIFLGFFALLLSTNGFAYWQLNTGGITASITLEGTNLNGFSCTDVYPRADSIVVSKSGQSTFRIRARIIEQSNSTDHKDRYRFRRARCGNKNYISLYSYRLPSAYSTGATFKLQKTTSTSQYTFSPLIISQNTKEIGIQYSIWHCPYTKMLNPSYPIYDTTKIINAGPVQGDWGPVGWRHWGSEPIDGYYCLGTDADLNADQKKLITRHALELAAAQVDYIYFDLTNWPEAYKCKSGLTCNSSSPSSNFEMTQRFKDEIHYPFSKIAKRLRYLRDSLNMAVPKISIWAGIKDNYKGRSIYYKNSLARWINEEYLSLVPSYMRYKKPGSSKNLLLLKINKNDYTAQASGDLLTNLSNSTFDKKFMWGFVSGNTLPQSSRTYNGSLTPLSDVWSFIEKCTTTSPNCNQRLAAGEQISVAPAYHDGLMTNSTSKGKENGKPGKLFKRQYKIAQEDNQVEYINISTWNSWIHTRLCSDGNYGNTPSEYPYPLNHSTALNYACGAGESYITWKGKSNMVTFLDGVNDEWGRDLEQTRTYYDCYLSYMRDSNIAAKNGSNVQESSYGGAICDFNL